MRRVEENIRIVFGLNLNILKEEKTNLIQYTFDITKDEIPKLERLKRYIPFKSFDEVNKYLLTKIPEHKIFIKDLERGRTVGYIFTGSKVIETFLYGYLKDTSPNSIDENLRKVGL